MSNGYCNRCGAGFPHGSLTCAHCGLTQWDIVLPIGAISLGLLGAGVAGFVWLPATTDGFLMMLVAAAAVLAGVVGIALTVYALTHAWKGRVLRPGWEKQVRERREKEERERLAREAEKQARETERRQKLEQCATSGHDWSEWSAVVPDRSPGYHPAEEAINEQMSEVFLGSRRSRERYCRRCGADDRM